MKHSDKMIRDYMARLGKRPKRMSPAAVAQRRAAAARSVAARAHPPAPGSAKLAHFKPRDKKGPKQPRGKTKP